MLFFSTIHGSRVESFFVCLQTRLFSRPFSLCCGWQDVRPALKWTPEARKRQSRQKAADGFFFFFVGCARCGISSVWSNFLFCLCVCVLMCLFVCFYVLKACVFFFLLLLLLLIRSKLEKPNRKVLTPFQSYVHICSSLWNKKKWKWWKKKTNIEPRVLPSSAAMRIGLNRSTQKKKKEAKSVRDQQVN